jgi:hypothetical protein
MGLPSGPYGRVGAYRIADNGTGIDPADIPRLFAVNRPLVSSKLKRLPLRGVLGNGLRVVMGAIAAYDGSIAVTSRGRRLTLAADPTTGATRVVLDEPVASAPGTLVETALSIFAGGTEERAMADLSIEVANKGQQYSGPSRAAWYSPRDLQELLARVTPATTTVGAVIRDVFEIDDSDRRIARELTTDDIEALHKRLCGAQSGKKATGDLIGHIGNLAALHYARVAKIASWPARKSHTASKLGQSVEKRQPRTNTPSAASPCS